MRGKLTVLALGIGVGALVAVRIRQRAEHFRESLSAEEIGGRIGRQVGRLSSQSAKKAKEFSRGFFTTVNSARKEREKELRAALFSENVSSGGADAPAGMMRRRDMRSGAAAERASGSQALRSDFSGVRPGDENDPLDDF